MVNVDASKTSDAINLAAENLHKVLLDMRGDLALITISNPPVNAGSFDVRRGLLTALEQAIAQGAVGAVLIGAGRCFVAGSDLREFGKPLVAPELPDVIRAIEDAPFPVVAALHGVALGGGLELALGCDYRIAAPDTQLGLPEVSLGFVPGAGGTQRLPRLVGVSKAITMICDAARIPATEARKIGLIDALVEGDLAEAAIAFLNEASRPKRLTKYLSIPTEDTNAIEAAEARTLKRGKGRPNVTEAIRLIKAAGSEPDKALADERQVFQTLRLGEDAFALRYLFFAERRAGSVDGIDPKLAKSLQKIGVIGGGMMGQGIVRTFLAAGLPVTLVERDADALQAAESKIDDSLKAMQSKGRLSSEARADRLKALHGTTEFAELTGCDLVIEAVFEDMPVKKDVLQRLEMVLFTDAIIATNTSYLDIDDMADGLAHPERVIGLHFFSPADIMPLLEVVRAAKTSDRVLATSLKLARSLGKQPVVSRVAEGFIGNRIYNAYRRRAELLVQDGASPQAVDQAAQDFGFAMGPFLVSDMSGLDIAWAMRKRHAATRDPNARYVTIVDSLCEAGRLGRKTGKGWYDYPDGKPQVSPEVTAVIADARTQAGIAPTALDTETETETVQRQLMAAIVNEAACLLDEGVAQRPSDVDVTLTNGYGFPRWRGGPLYWAAEQEIGSLQSDLAALAAAIGHGHRAGSVRHILDQLNASNES